MLFLFWPVFFIIDIRAVSQNARFYLCRNEKIKPLLNNKEKTKITKPMNERNSEASLIRLFLFSCKSFLR